MRQKTSFFLLFCLQLLFFSCYRKDSWELLSLSSTKAPQSCAKLLYPATSYLHDMEVEFVKVDDEIFSYISIFSGIIPPSGEEESKAKITLSSFLGKKEFLVNRLEGGQKLKIPQEALEEFIMIFAKSPEITVQIQGSYKQVIDTKKFPLYFSKLKKYQTPTLPPLPISLSL